MITMRTTPTSVVSLTADALLTLVLPIQRKYAPVSRSANQPTSGCSPWAAVLISLLCATSHAQTQAPAIDAFSEQLSACFSSADQAQRDNFSRRNQTLKTLPAKEADAFHAAEDIRLQALDDECLSALARQLDSALHASAPAGFDITPTLNLETLYPRFYRVPPPIGLHYRATAGDGAAFITHEQLLADWLRRPRSQIPERIDRIDIAVDSGVFYAAIFSDYVPARVAARLPVQPPPESTAAALLITESETAVLSAPTTLVATLITGDLVVAGTQRLATRLPPAPACNTPQVRRLLAKSKHDDAQRLFRACYTQALAGTAALDLATREAQAFVDRLGTALVNR